MGNLQQLCENLKQEITIPNTVDYFEFLSLKRPDSVQWDRLHVLPNHRALGSHIFHWLDSSANVQLKFIQIKEMLDLQRCECELSPWSVCSTHACNCGNRAAIVKINNCCGDISQHSNCCFYETQHNQTKHDHEVTSRALRMQRGHHLFVAEGTC